MEKYYTYQILLYIIKNICSESDIRYFSNDEIVIEYQKVIDTNEMKKYIQDELGLLVSIESFKLNNIKDYNYFVKEMYDGTIEFKCIPIVYFAQAYKLYKGLEINDYDLSFFYENKLAKFNDKL
jgi:hypothetical protein